MSLSNETWDPETYNSGELMFDMMNGCWMMTMLAIKEQEFCSESMTFCFFL